MLDLTIYCLVPLILLTLVLFYLPFLSASERPATIDPESIPPINQHIKKYLSLKLAGIVLFISILCFTQRIGIPGYIFYWQFFYYDRVLILPLAFSIIAAIITRRNLPSSRFLLRSDHKKQLLANMAFVAAGGFFWITCSTFTCHNWTPVDRLMIGGNQYNLMAHTNNKDRQANLILLKCDSHSIICRGITDSHTDWSGCSMDGRLIYDPNTQELSAEANSCFRYIGFTYQINDPGLTSGE
ncbi:MAG: hypothetical protein JXA42_17350 [Anaerolineales bacterium]|nr:hypothetical protein [Anaerolineales bacterium]